MSDVFQAAAEATLKETSQASSPEGNSQPDLAPESQDNPQASATGSENPTKADVAQAIADLGKMDKFVLEGQEWTLKDLKAAIMRQKDYTQKTMALSEERKAFQEDKKFFENLAWDLEKVKGDPALANEFVKVYPKAFHKYVENYLSSNSQQGQQQSVPGQQSQPPVDVQLLSRLDQLEKHFHAQEVSKNEKLIEQTMEKLSAKYPDAANFKEMVLGRAYEAHNGGVSLTEEAWEDIYKQVQSEVEGLLKAKYSNLVKQQTEANSKSRDVGAGGGTAGRAPVSFKRFDDLAKHAESIARGG
jgi:hypothetical protein